MQRVVKVNGEKVLFARGMWECGPGAVGMREACAGVGDGGADKLSGVDDTGRVSESGRGFGDMSSFVCAIGSRGWVQCRP